jgi:hypothetical protein
MTCQVRLFYITWVRGGGVLSWGAVYTGRLELLHEFDRLQINLLAEHHLWGGHSRLPARGTKSITHNPIVGPPRLTTCTVPRHLAVNPAIYFPTAQPIVRLSPRRSN